jgi:hypothetical protein
MALIQLGTSACALYNPTSSSKSVVKECNIPSDQSGTITAKWPVIPIPIALHQGDFDDSEASSISAAASTWNTFFTASSSVTTLDPGSSGSIRTSSNSNPRQAGSICAQGIMQGNTKFTGNVVIYKLSKWSANYPQNAMALTTTCFLQATPYPKFYMAVMEINYQNFFVSGTKVPDLQSIVLHELGHLHGLNHSCEATTKSGTPNCNDPNLNPDYIVASMFPTFSFDPSGIGEQKRDLQSNDQGRANCLYSGSGSTN